MLLSKVLCYDKWITTKLTWERLWRGNPPYFSPMASFQFLKPQVRNTSDILLVSAQSLTLFLLYYFNKNKAKRFILHLVVYDSWPLFKPQRLKGLIGRLFVPKLLLQKCRSLWVIRGYHPTLEETNLKLCNDLSLQVYFQNCNLPHAYQ